MAYVDWSIKGPEPPHLQLRLGLPPVSSASCRAGGYCRDAVAMRIDEGHFGDVRLDGLHWVSLLAWPGRSITATASVRRSSTSARTSASARRS